MSGRLLKDRIQDALRKKLRGTTRPVERAAILTRLGRTDEARQIAEKIIRRAHVVRNLIPLPK